MKMNWDKPITKKELKEELALTEGELRQDITAAKNELRQEMAATKDELRMEIGEVRDRVDRLDSRVDRLDAKVDRVAVKVVGLEAGLGELNNRVATKEDIFRLMGRMDDFAGMLTAYDRGSVVRGALLDEHAGTLRDHEGRISRLEAGR